jgi:sulfofructosephosphate aldolase
VTDALAGVADEAGRFSVLAIDHRDSFRRFLRPDAPDALAADELTAMKVALIAGVADLVSGVMLEPELSIPQVLDAGVLPPGVGFLAALEAQGYLDDPGATPTTILDGWSVAAAKASGASAAKLLLPYHPDRPLASAQERVAASVIEECARVALPLALEPLFYDLDHPSDRPRVVVQTVRRFAAMSPALLKLPYPGSADACDEVSAIATMPWAMLSGGGSFEDFADQLDIAVAHGCAGFMVGRALWGEAMLADPARRGRQIETQVRDRLHTLLAITAQS